jgi:hypothetical protein
MKYSCTGTGFMKNKNTTWQKQKTTSAKVSIRNGGKLAPKQTHLDRTRKSCQDDYLKFV